jgi:hypothetical protein
MQLAEDLPDLAAAIKDTAGKLRINGLPMLDYQILRWVPNMDEKKFGKRMTPWEKLKHGSNKLKIIKTFQRKK